MTSMPIAAPRSSRASLWILAAALVALELAIASLVLAPRVSPAYAAYYVEQRAPCYLPQGVPVIDLGRTVGATTRVALSRCIADRGWLNPRQRGTVLRGASGKLTFRLAAVPTVDLRFSFIAFATGRQPAPAIAILANGRDLGTVRLSRGSQSVHSVVIPRGTIGAGPVTLTIALRPDGYPQARRLSLLRWRLDPADAPPLMALAAPGYY